MGNENEYRYTDPKVDDPNQPPEPPKDLPSPGIDQQQASSAPTSPYNREQFRNEWMGTGTNTNLQNQLLSRYGLSADGAGRVALPQDVNGHAAETLDLRIGARSGQNLAGWTDIGQNGGAGGGTDYGSGAIGSGAGGAGGGGYQDQIRALLLQQLQKSGQPVDPNSPEIKASMDAASADAQRQLAGEQKALAESQYAQGGGSSNELQQGMQQSRERVAGSLAGLRGQLMQRATEQRVGQLQQALALAVQSGDAAATREIQMELGRMQNALGQAQLGQQGRQWDDSFGLDAARFRYMQDRDLAGYGTGA